MLFLFDHFYTGHRLSNKDNVGRIDGDKSAKPIEETE